MELKGLRKKLERNRKKSTQKTAAVCFTSCSCSRGDGDEKSKLFVDLQDSLHLSKRLVWLGNAGCCGFCTVHTGTSAEADDRLAVIVQIHVKGFVHIDGCWIGNGFVAAIGSVPSD